MVKKKGKKIAKVKVKEVKGQLGKKKETARENDRSINWLQI